MDSSIIVSLISGARDTNRRQTGKYHFNLKVMRLGGVLYGSQKTTASYRGILSQHVVQDETLRDGFDPRLQDTMTSTKKRGQ